MLVHDLRRLKALLALPGGPKRLIIFESPLAPQIAADYRDRPSGPARSHREVAASTCTDLGLECSLGGLPELNAALNEAWPDATHAPAVDLGARLRTVVDQSSGCGSGAL